MRTKPKRTETKKRLDEAKDMLVEVALAVSGIAIVLWLIIPEIK